MVGIALGDGGPRNLPLSMGMRAGDFIFVSGQVGFGLDGKIVAGGIEAETHQTLYNIGKVLALDGAALADVVKVTVWLADPADFAAFNAVYQTFFPQTRPARSTVKASLLLEARVEIEAIAFAGVDGGQVVF